MKRFLVFAFSLATATFAFAQPSLTGSPAPVAIAPQPQSDAAPGITFDKTTHDFGVVAQGKPVTYKFIVTNTGKADLIIGADPTPVKASCGCTTPNWTKTAIKPGETGFVEATYNAANAGPFTKTVTVPSNAGTPVILYLKGEVKSDTMNLTAPASGPTATPATGAGM